MTDEEQALCDTALHDIAISKAQAYLRVNNIAPAVYCAGCLEACDAIVTLVDEGGDFVS